ncbi:MAG: hypothetical protein ACJ79X_13735 [Gemmatimonadaceae bacterium]|jgi:hypothetical protein
MKPLRHVAPLALAGLVALQISCGDSSGPGASASSIEANSPTSIAAAPGTQVAELPSVIVRDASGNPISGVTVTFAVTSGGGSVTGGKAVSTSEGVATVGSWTLGQNPGVNTLTATAPGLAAVTFTAQGADPCSSAANHTLGSTTTGQLSPTDCRFSDGSLLDFYSVTIPTAGTYTFTQTGSFDTYMWLWVFTTQVPLVAINDDSIAATPNTSSIKAILPAGNFLIGANSLDPNITGSYTLKSASTPAHITNCEDVFVLAGITSDQSLQPTDCTANGFVSDDYVVWLRAGQSVTATMSSGSVDSYLEIHADGSATILASNDNVDATTQNARVALTAPADNFYIITARAATAGVTGPYTLGIQ